MKPLPILLVMSAALAVLLSGAAPARADGKSKAAQEIAEQIARRFGKEAAKDGTEVLARRIVASAARHGGDHVLQAVKKVGPQALHLVEQAGAHGPQLGSQAARF